MTLLDPAERKARKLNLERVTEARDYLDNALHTGDYVEAVPYAHRALRMLSRSVDPEDPLPMDATAGVQLADFILDALEELTEAYAALAVEKATPREPADEYERLLALAEKNAVENRPDVARALAEVASRWVTEDFYAARSARPLPDVIRTLSPAESALLDFEGLKISEEDSAQYIAAAAQAAASRVPLEALAIVARVGARGSLLPHELIELRRLLDQPTKGADQ